MACNQINTFERSMEQAQMARGYSITLIVGVGFPGHASIQINGPEETTYAGLGPVERFRPYSEPGSYDVVSLPTGTSPVGAIKKDHPEDEYSYVDASKYSVKSYTFAISRQQALDAIDAARKYQGDNPNYNAFTQAHCTDFALKIVEAALPGTDLSRLSRVPSRLQQQLDEASQNGSMVALPIGPLSYKYDTRLPGFQPDATPPQFAPPPAPPAPAFQPDAVYSPDGQFMGNFPRVLGDRLHGDPTTVPPHESFPNFDNRFSAVYAPAPTAIGDGRGIGRLLDIATTYANNVGDRNSSVVGPNFVGPSIPFVSRPNGSLAAPGGSTLLDPVPMDPAAPGPFPTGGQFVPRSLPPRPLYPTGALVPSSNVRVQDQRGSLDDRAGDWGLAEEDADRYRSPVLRELQRYRQLAASGGAAASSSATSHPGIPLASGAVGSGAGGPWGGVLKWVGNGLIGSAEASQPNLLPQVSTAPDFVGENDGSISDANEAALAPDNRRYLVRRIANEASAFDRGVQAVPFISTSEPHSADRPNSFDDRFGSWPSASNVMQPALRQQVSRPLGLVSGQPMPDWPISPPIFDFPVRSGGSANDRGSEQPRGTGIPMLDEYLRYLNREYPT